MRILTCVAVVLIQAATPVIARACESVSELNALKDIASAQQKQAELAREQAQRDRERARREESAYVNAQRDAQSARRFDKH